jgi:YVTN family beta-propeller protein
MPIVRASITLKLAYAFISMPNPIRASASGANPNVVNLQVIVSNPTLAAINLHQVTIEIPTGEDISRDISSSRDLPSPVYDTSGPWSISTAGGAITIKPRSGNEAPITSPILFSLNGIQVNQTPGTVPLTITEMLPPAPKVVDTSSYRLVKERADFPVTSFYADPSTVTDLGQAVTLYWTCSDQGKLDAYGLRIASIRAAVRRSASEAALVADVTPVAAGNLQSQDDAPFKNCVVDGNCYTWQAGVAGVATPAVNQTTTFALDIVETDGAGHRTVVGSLTTTVQVTVPWISQNSYVAPIFGGRALRLHWLAFNAKSCTIEVDGVTVDDAAPTDTYNQGYLYLPPDGSGPRTIAVIAHAATGRAQASFTFPPQRVTPVVSISGFVYPGSIAISRDGALALVTNNVSGSIWGKYSESVTVVDVRTRTADPNPLPVQGLPVAGAITPDGSLGLIVTGVTVRVIDVPGRKVESAAIPVSNGQAIAITPDGKTALVTGLQAPSISVIDIPGRKVETTISVGRSSAGVAITPDGKLALVTNVMEGTVTVVDIPKRTADPKPIDLGKPVFGVAITPDGALALVANVLENSVSVIDIAKRTVVGKTIPTGQQPAAIAITPDGALALVPNFNGKNLTIVDIARRSSVTIGWAGSSAAVGITPDGKTALLPYLGNGSFVGVI